MLAHVSLFEIFPMFFSQILSTSDIRANDSSLSSDGWTQFDPVSKVFLMEVSGKRVPYKCVNDSISKRSFASALEGVYQYKGRTFTWGWDC